MDHFGAKLKDLRTRYGMTQADLAKLSELGQSTISALETGRQNPWPSTRRALSHAFQMSLEEFDAITMGQPPMPVPGRAAMGGRSEASGPWQPPPAADGPPVAQAAAPASGGQAVASGGGYPFAQSKIMELLNELGETQQKVSRQASLIHILCPLCWTTDSTLRLTGVWGALAEGLESRAGDLTGQPVRGLLAAALGAPGPESSLLALHRKAASGRSVSLVWEQSARRFIVFVDPIRDAEEAVIGTVGIAIDVTNRVAEPAAG